MYLPKKFEEKATETLHTLINNYPFGALIINCDGEIVANHMPFLFEPSRGDFGALNCHVAKANSVWRSMSEDTECLVIFQGPDCYISPSWYPSKRHHGKAVPTWDYVVVHARGYPKVIDNSEWLINHVSDLSSMHEVNRPNPWKVSDAPVEYINRMIGAIIGIEITISKLSGKWKVSQNRPKSDQLGILAGLETEDSQGARAISDIIKKYTAGG